MTHEFGVFIAPAASGDPDGLAAASGLSRADAKMLLVSKLPRRVTLEPTPEAATSRAKALKEAGFDAFVVTRSALAKPPPPRAKIFSMDGASLILDVFRFGPGELKLVVEGEILRATEEQRIEREHVEGIQVYQKTDVTRHSDGERFLLLYGDGHEKAVEIRPRAFNFRALGADFGPTAGVNTARFIERLRAIFPGFVHDDRLRRFPPFPEEGFLTYDPSLYDSSRDRKLRKDDNEKAALATARLIAMHVLRR